MTDPTTPQDAPRPAADQPPHGATPSWPTWRPATPAPTHEPPSEPEPVVGAPTQPVPTRTQSAPAPTSAPTSAPTGRPEVTYLPAPSGPNWGLVVLGLLFVLVAGGVVANQLVGFQVTQLTEVGPSVLVIGGLACAAVGAVGILARRR